MAGTGPLRELWLRPGMAELSGSLAHELNQPLTAISSNAQAARDYFERGVFDRAELGEILADIVNDASRASEIVRGVRGLVLGEAPRTQVFNVRQIVDQALDLVRTNATARGVVIRSDVPDGLRQAVGDAVEIRLALLNLLVNALDAVETIRDGRERRVTVLARPGGDAIRILVRDNGCGVGPRDLDRMFWPFYSSKAKGMGLGLPFSRAVIERNGGRIAAFRNSDSGMTFECVLPGEPKVRPPASSMR